MEQEREEGYKSFFSIIRATMLRKNIQTIKNLLTDCMQKTVNPESRIDIETTRSSDFYIVYNDLSENSRDNLVGNRMVISLHGGNLSNPSSDLIGSRSHLHEGTSYSSVSDRQKADLVIKFSRIPTPVRSGQIYIKNKSRRELKPIHKKFINCLEQVFNRIPILFTTIEGTGKPTPSTNREGRPQHPAYEMQTYEALTPSAPSIKSVSSVSSVSPAISTPGASSVLSASENQEQIMTPKRLEFTEAKLKEDDEFKVVSKKKGKKRIDSENVSPNIRGGYYLKYIKYKAKYINLKKQLESRKL
jgi:hypothetical protein